MSFDLTDFDGDEDMDDIEMKEEVNNQQVRMPYEWLARARDPSKLRKRGDRSTGVSYQDQLKSLQDKVERENTPKESPRKTTRLVKRKPGQPMSYSERVHELSMEKCGYKTR